MIRWLFTERIEFRLEMPIIGWIILGGYVAVYIIYRLLVIGKVVLGYD